MIIFPKPQAWSGEGAEERRKEERLEVRLPAEVLYMDEERKVRLQVLHTKNISSGGAYFQGSEMPGEGSSLELTVYMLNQEPALRVRLLGEVKRCEPEGMAVAFANHFDLLPLRQA